MTHSKAASLAGLVLCAVSIVAGQIVMSCWLTPGAAQNSEVAEDIGYTFTGLTAVLGFILWRWGRLGNASCQTKAHCWRSRILQAIVAVIPIFFGCAYFCIAGEQVERYARTFAVLPPFVYLLAVIGQKNYSYSISK
ncbi:MAG: hypothetical protein LBB40_00550 [Holophagales bacterium]|nr:hypothetical protein [Holophagales bacterium]